jgi:hypothetical protein
MPIILLDLNFTLVENSKALGPPFLASYPVEQETYRLWLLPLLKGHRVELITARPTFLESRTLENMRRLLGGWMPDAVHFNPVKFQSAPVWKEKALLANIFPKYGTDPAQFLALESNTDTRAMYQRHGIFAVPVPKDGSAWTKLPEKGTP